MQKAEKAVGDSLLYQPRTTAEYLSNLNHHSSGAHHVWEVLARYTCPLVAGALVISGGALALFPNAVEVRMLQELLARQPL